MSHRWPNNGRCNATDEELSEVIATSDEDLARMFSAPDEPRLVQHATVGVRLVCQRVLEARRRGADAVERKALGSTQRWGRRGQGVTALAYIARNVALLHPELEAVPHIPRRLRPRRDSRDRRGGLTRPVNTRRVTR